MNTAFRVSLVGNAILLASICVLAIYSIRQYLESQEYIDRRPRGAIIKTDTKLNVFYTRTGQPAFALPKGTILQESTPGGISTLGKFTDREYLLTIKSSSFSFTDNSISDRSETWSDGYTFNSEEADTNTTEQGAAANP